MQRLAPLVACALLLGPAPSGRAQYVPPPKADETHATLNWLIGRWRMPVTCEREDGSRVQVEEAVVVRPAAEDASGRTVRAIFFGIDVRDARRCFNLTHGELPDRRGVLYLTFVSHGRSDVGLSRLRQNLESGDLEYEITRGRLHIRPFGDESAEPARYEFEGRDALLRVSILSSSSDGYRLLASLADGEPSAGSLRRLHFAIEGLESAVFQGDYLETPRPR